ncbi:MAG: sigma-54-dependent Fis family transcriptional regulator [Desulfobacterales bacterium]|nr:sigma-54-dependent Fis family transcriptional regulator [Desulfobacterales bacterium]
MKSREKFSDLISFFNQKGPGIPGDRNYDLALCRILTRASSSEAASIWKLTPGARLCLAYGTNVDMAETGTFFLEVGEGISGAAALSQKTIAVHQAVADARHSARLDNIIGFHTKSMISAPIMAQGHLYGVINIVNRKAGGPFPEKWKERLSVIGALYAYALFSAGCPRTAEDTHAEALKQSQGLIDPEKTVVVGIAPGIQSALGMALKAGRTDIPVLILGETGTGKELIARRVHEAGKEKERPFLAVNCAAVSESLMESELFGHVKGAFSGAVSNRKGKFAAASGGILFLDEIGDMSLPCQAKILRAIQEKKIVPLGSEKEVPCRVRIVAATNKDLNTLVLQGKFREDLYYRLCGMEIRLPPLRQRREDIELLATYFLKRAPETEQKILSDDAIEILKNFSWPGNVRQLEQAVMASAAISDKFQIYPEHFPPWLHKAMQEKTHFDVQDGPSISNQVFPAMSADDEIEKKRYLEALRATCFPGTGRWNISAAARQLNIARKTLAYRMQKLNLVTKKYDAS